MLADYFVEAGKMKSVKYNSERIEVEYEDKLDNQVVRQGFVLIQPSIDFATKLLRANK